MLSLPEIIYVNQPSSWTDPTVIASLSASGVALGIAVVSGLRDGHLRRKSEDRLTAAAIIVCAEEVEEDSRKYVVVQVRNESSFPIFEIGPTPFDTRSGVYKAASKRKMRFENRYIARAVLRPGESLEVNFQTDQPASNIAVTFKTANGAMYYASPDHLERFPHRFRRRPL